MVTELYMVEKWERVTIRELPSVSLADLFWVLKTSLFAFPDVIFLVIFLLFWYFNYSVLLSFTGRILGITPISSVLHAATTSKFSAAA